MSEKINKIRAILLEKETLGDSIKAAKKAGVNTRLIEIAYRDCERKASKGLINEEQRRVINTKIIIRLHSDVRAFFK